ncbi:hypothetical protein [Streptomyces sp. WAC 05379]|uniref:hypothetical protein n=1 Tax=Streptomyces sp. WAC 05379 TaxID=2203207 RepID=UPI00163C64E8|nr:hypothetical protein [Streptomyces sp. WAC 05379]
MAPDATRWSDSSSVTLAYASQCPSRRDTLLGSAARRRPFVAGARGRVTSSGPSR